MPSNPFKPRYAAALRYAHWISAALVIGAYAAILSRKLFARGSPERMLGLQFHFLLGIVVLLITVPRIVRRLRSQPPPISPPLSPFWAWGAHLAHLALYTFLLVQPLLGFVSQMMQGHGIPLPYIGLTIPSLFGEDKELARSLRHIHEFIGTAFYYVIGVHVAAALWHLLVRRDDTVQRMV